MPKRKVVFAPNEFYHIYNRSTGATTIFSGNKTLNRALALIDFYRYPQRLKFSKYLSLSKEARISYEKSFRKEKPLIEIYAFAIMPDHFHFLLKLSVDYPLQKFVANFQNSFAKFFNKRNDRYGSLFQGPFKSKYVQSENYLLHLSRYIHLNPVTSYLIDIDKLKTYPGTSLPYYANPEKNSHNLVNTELLIKLAGSLQKYLQFTLNQADYQRRLKKIRGLTLD